jgi:purine-binding chemotaxis protein CheW
MNELHVVFKVGASEYTLPASAVLHMEAFVEATPVPGTAPYVRGLMQVRGRVLPIVDLRARFGEAAHVSPEARVVIVESAGRSVGLLADTAREVLPIDVTRFKDAPEILSATSQGFVKAVAEVNGRLLMLLDIEKVIGQEGSNAHAKS